MRFIALLLALVAAAAGFAQDNTAPVLVLLQPARASGIEADDYHKGWWVRWPVALPGRGNRLWSLLSGQDWVGLEGGYTFRPQPDGTWNYPLHRELILNGYFQSLGYGVGRGDAVVLSDGGGMSPNALFLGLNIGTTTVPVQPMKSRWDAPAIAVFEARSWNDIAALRKLTSGPLLVVEYPPPDDVRLSRLWPLGPWPKTNPLTDAYDKPMDELGVPGLIQAKNVGKLLNWTGQFRWTIEEPRENPARWMKAMRGAGVWLLGIWGALAALAFVLAARFVTSERQSLWLGVAMEAALVSPAAAVVAGSAGRVTGADTVPILFPAVTFLLWLATLGARKLATRFLPGAHPLWSLSAVGVLSMLLFDPAWSVLGSTFNPQPEPGPPEAYGALIAYLIGFNLLLPELTRFRMLVHLSFFALPIWGVASQRWWLNLGWAALLLPLIGWEFAGERIRKQSPIALAVLSLAAALAVGFCVAPFELLTNGGDGGKINAYVYFRFIASPPLLAVLVLGGFLTLFGDRFFLYRVRKLVKADRRRVVLLRFSLCTFAIGLFNPWLLFVALFVFLGGLGLLLRDGLVEEELLVEP